MSYKMLLLAFQIYFLVVTCSGQGTVFTEQPSPGPVFLAPFGQRARLRCSVIKGYRIEWGVTLPDQTREALSDLPGVQETLTARGIVVESPDDETSLLVINATESTNGTAATCIAINRNDAISRDRGRRVQLIIFSLPSTPTNLTASENGVRSLRISWLFHSVEGVDVQFILTATNLNASSARPIVHAGIQEEHYIFTVEDSSSCDVYTFQVTALNDAGSSGPSEILTRSLPSLPDISAVEDSLELSLVKTADNEVTLSVMIQEITSCPEYPVTSYTLVLVDSEGNETRESSEVTSGEITLVVDGLMEDSLYSYYIVATNMIGGKRLTASVDKLTTSDVQGLNLCVMKTNANSINIQCIYITGSDARGCVYTLVIGVEGAANITGTIDRSSSEGVQLQISELLLYSQVFVSDWDEAPSPPIRVNITHPIKSCEEEPDGTSSGGPGAEGDERASSTNNQALVPIIASVMAIFMLLTALLAAALIVYYYFGRKNKKKPHGDSSVGVVNNEEHLYECIDYEEINTRNRSHIKKAALHQNQGMLIYSENPSYNPFVKPDEEDESAAGEEYQYVKSEKVSSQEDKKCSDDNKEVVPADKEHYVTKPGVMNFKENTKEDTCTKKDNKEKVTPKREGSDHYGTGKEAIVSAQNKEDDISNKSCEKDDCATKVDSSPSNNEDANAQQEIQDSAVNKPVEDYRDIKFEDIKKMA